MKNWYIVQSHSSFENKVAGLIKEEAEKAKISDKFDEIIVPTHDITEVKRGKRVQRKKKFFPGYVLIKIDLTKELSIILARDFSGNIVSYPVAENYHKKGILDTSIMPGNVSQSVKDQIFQFAVKIIQHMNYCGVLCVEFFLSGNKTYVNELAPRPHNSGHQTIEACKCSQFEQQVRISTSMSLGSTDMNYSAITKNLMGDLWFEDLESEKIVEPNWELYKKSGLTIYLYGKKTPKVGRKMGHTTEIFSKNANF